MRTVIDIDDEALGAAARVLGTTTKVSTVNRALQEIAARADRPSLVDTLDRYAQDLDDPEVMKDAWRRQ